MPLPVEIAGGTVKVTNPDGSNVGAGGGGGASTIASGADVTEGATGDAAVITDTTGTVNGKLRGLVKWAFERMPSALGTNTMANSLPVTLASDGPAVTGIGGTADAIVAAGASGSLSAKLRRVTQGLEDLKTLQVLAAGEAHIGQIGGVLVPVVTEVTRPSDTTAYAANDAIAPTVTAVWTFTGAARASGKSGAIVVAIAMCDNVANTARLEVDVYMTAPTAIADNAEATQLYTNKSIYLGTITFPALVKKTANSTMVTAYAFPALPFATSGSANLFGIVRTLDAFTPASGSKYALEFLVSQD
jgi:hypothetical protein